MGFNRKVFNLRPTDQCCPQEWKSAGHCLRTPSLWRAESPVPHMCWTWHSQLCSLTLKLYCLRPLVPPVISEPLTHRCKKHRNKGVWPEVCFAIRPVKTAAKSNPWHLYERCSSLWGELQPVYQNWNCTVLIKEWKTKIEAGEAV